MLTLVDSREVVGQYKELFGAILKKRSVNVLTIEMSGIFSSLVGALGAVAEAEEVTARSYDRLTIRLGGYLLTTVASPRFGRSMATLSV